jgi:hypothetical protein
MIRKFNNFVPMVYTVNLFGTVVAPSVLTNTEEYIETDLQPRALFSRRSKRSKMAAALNAGEPERYNLSTALILFAGGA